MTTKLEKIFLETFKLKYSISSVTNSHKKNFSDWTNFISKRFFHFIADHETYIEKDFPSYIFDNNHYAEYSFAIRDIAGSRMLQKPCYIILSKETAEKIAVLNFIA